MRAKPPPKMGGLGAKPPSLELTHFVTGSVMFFVVFPAFHNLYTPPKTPSFPTGPAVNLANYSTLDFGNKRNLRRSDISCRVN